ncbi:MAG: PAS domain-containing protein [Halodesulfurarchaeum sp.]
MSHSKPNEAGVSEHTPIVAMLDCTGQIIWTNQAWTAFGSKNGLPESYAAVGENYLEVTRLADAESAQRVAEGLAEILGGRQRFTTVYSCHSPGEKRWFRLYAYAVPYDNETGCVLIHRNITEQLPRKTVATSPEESNQVTMPSHDSSRVVTYLIDPKETIEDALLEAFEAVLDFDLYAEDTVVYDWLDIEPLNELLNNSGDCRVVVQMWDYRVTISSEKISIYI